MMVARTGRPCSFPPVLGALMLVHLAFVCVVKASLGLSEDVLWLCHVALGLAGVGLLLRSTWLVSLALTCSLIPQSLWLFDFITGRLMGIHPLGVTLHLESAGLLTWLATAHHFYLIPLLLFIAARDRFYHRDVVLAAVVVAAAVTVTSRVALSEDRNVNSAYAMLPHLDRPVLHWANSLDTPRYLLFLNCVIAGGMLVPASVLLREISLRSRPQRLTTEPDDVDPCVASE